MQDRRSDELVLPWSRRVGVHLGLLLLLAWMLMILGLGGFSVSMYLDEREGALARHADDVRSIVTVLEQIDSSGKRNAERLMAEFKTIVNPAMLSWSPEDKLLYDDRPLEGDVRGVDLFHQRTGGVATIFERRDDDFTRITTNLQRQDGMRAVGTQLGKTHPAYDKLMKGERYVGKATLFGQHYMTVYDPVKIDGQVRAVLFIGYDLASELSVLDKMLRSLGSDTRQVGILDIGKGAHEGHWLGLDAKPLQAQDPLLQAVREEAGKQQHGRFEWSDVQALPGKGPVNVVWHQHEPWGWVAVSMQRDWHMTEPSRNDMILLWSIIGATLILTIVMLTWFIRRRVLQPLRQVCQDLHLLAQGRLDCALSVRGHDEFAQLSRSAEELRRSWLDLVVRFRQNAEQVASSAEQIAGGNQDLSARTEQSAASLEETAASTAALAETVRHGSEAARTANQLAAQASSIAQGSGDSARQAIATIEAIQASSQRIADITSVIDGIAFQTNILALNAAVEAARAGEAGRGFAVVAGEVRQLAQRSAEAARQIKALIEESVTQIHSGSRQVQAAGSSMMQVVDAVRRVADTIGEVSASAQEQSEGIAQINTAMGQLEQSTQQNAALVEEATAAARAMQQQARELLKALEFFQTGRSGEHAAVAAAATASPAQLPQPAIS